MSAQLGAPPVPLTLVLSRVEAELEALSRQSEHMQDVLSGFLMRVDLKADDLVAPQILDSITQHIAALSQFTSGLRNQVDGDIEVRPLLAAQALTLADLAKRLARAPAKTVAKTPRKKSAA